MVMHFFRSKAKKFSLTGEHRFAYDAPDFAQRAADIGGELKKVETQASKEKLEKISQLKERARTAMVDGEKQTIQLRQFALRTNVFLTKESVKVNNVQAHIPDAMIKAEYIKTLIDRAGWGVEQKESPNVTFLRTNKDKMLADVQDDFAAFQKDPKGKFEDFRSLLEESAKLIDPSVRISAQNADALRALLLSAGWVESSVKTETSKQPEVEKKEELHLYLGKKKGEIQSFIQKELDNFMDKPSDATFDQLLAAMNARLQKLPEKRTVHAVTPDGMLALLYDAQWINRGQKERALNTLHPPVQPPAPEKPRAAAPNLAEDAKQLKNSVLMHRSAPVGSPDWNIAANALMRLCAIDWQHKPNEIPVKLAEMGAVKTSEGFFVKDQRKMFYALRDVDVGGSLFQQGQHISDIKDSIDRSKAYETGEQNNLPHWRAMQEVKRRYELRAGAKAEITGRKGGMVDTNRLYLEQFSEHTFVMEHQSLNKYLENLRLSHTLNANQRRIWESIRSMLKTCEKQIYNYKPDENDYKKGALNDIRRGLESLRRLLDEKTPVPESFAVLEAQMEKRYTQLLLDAPRFNDARFLKDCYHVAVTREETAELKTLFGNLLSTWASSNVLEKQNMLKKFDDMVVSLNTREQRAGGTGMVNRHFEDVPMPSRTINQQSPRFDQRSQSGNALPVSGFAGVGMPNDLSNFQPSPGADAPPVTKPKTATDRYLEKGIIDSEGARRVEENMSEMERTMKAKDRYTVVVPVDRGDAYNAGTTIMIWSKNKGFPYRLHYSVSRGQWSGDTDASIAKQYGIWIGKETGTTREGRGYNSGITIHFTRNEPYIVQKTGTGTPFYQDVELERNRLKNAEAAKIAEVKRYAENKWNFNLTNAAKNEDGQKFGYYYEHSDDAEIVYSADPSMKQFYVWDTRINTWEKISDPEETISDDVRAKLLAKVYDSEKSLPKKMRTVRERPSVPVAQEGGNETVAEQGENATLNRIRTLNSELQALLSQSLHGQTTSDAMDRNLGFDWTRVNKVILEMDALFNKTERLSAQDLQGARELFQNMQEYNTNTQLDGGKQNYARLTQRMQEFIDKSTPAKPKLDGPKKFEQNSETPAQSFEAIWKEWEALSKKTDAAFTAKVIEPQTRRLSIEAEEQVLGKFFKNEAFQGQEFADRMTQIQQRIQRLAERRKKLEM